MQTQTQTLEPVMEMTYPEDFDLNPEFDLMVKLYGLNPDLDIVLYDGPDGDLLDAMDRTEPEPWFPPNDLESFARHLALQIGTTYTSYTRENAESLRWMLENGRHSEPASVAEWVQRYHPDDVQHYAGAAEIAVEAREVVDATLLALPPTGALPIFREPTQSLLGLGEDIDVDDQ